MKNKIFMLFLLFFIFICVSCKDKSDNNIKFNIIELNDIHGSIERDKNGGISDVAKKINDIRNEDKLDNTILIGNGDMFQGTALSKVSDGRIIIDIMNEMKFDMMGIGNHEFDWGIDKITNYFDGNNENGEANFPLINSNIVNVGTTTPAFTELQNASECSIVEKSGVKFGFISLIGDVYTSINYNMIKDYEISLDYKGIVSDLGKKLKKNGCDVVIVNIHDGSTSGVTSLKTNKDIASLKYNDSYLVDVIINGHTHTKQQGFIERANGTSVPVVQSSGNLDSFGRIDINYNKKKGVVSSKITNISSTKETNYDTKVEDIISTYYNKSKNDLEEVYCDTKYISRYSLELQKWVSNIMMSSTSSSAAMCNIGAFRANVAAGEFDFTKLYALTPFDNRILLTTIKGKDLKNVMSSYKESIFFGTNEGYVISNIEESKEYTLAILDFIYFKPYFAPYRNSYIDTGISLRDLMIEELRLHNDSGLDLDNDSSALITKKI